MNALDEQDSDYDVFASVRPKKKPVENVVIDKEEDDVDPFASVRPKKDRNREMQKPKNKPHASVIDTIKDVAKQGVKETLIGLGGTHGDIGSMLTEETQTKAQEEQNTREFDVLQRMEQPGYEPTWSDIMTLQDDSMLPKASRGPTSKELNKINKMIGGPGEAETTEGKYAGRIGKLFGSGLALAPLAGAAALNPAPALVAGALGQTVEEMGGGPVAQAASEILGLLVTPAGGFRKLATTAERQMLRDLGYSDQAIVMAENYASKGKKFGIRASKSIATEEAFENFAKHSDTVVKELLETAVPGFEKGSKHVHQMASNAYGKIVEDASKLSIKNLDPFINTIDNTIKDVNKIIGYNAEAKSFITELAAHASDVIEKPIAENMIEFYKKLNRVGKWVGRSQKDRMVTNVKNSIKDTFKAEGPAGVKLAENFETVNAGIQRAYQAERLAKLVNKSSTQNGINYTSLSKKLDNPDNLALFQEVLGKKNANNFQLVVNTGKKVKDFDKSYRAASVLSESPLSTAGKLAYGAYSGNWAFIASLQGGQAMAKKLAELSLTDPRFQNLTVRALHAIQKESPKLFRVVNDEMKKYMQEKVINQK
jgi:hypothetical protein